MNTKFYTHEEKKLPKGASGVQLKDFVRRQISLKEALELDAQIGEELMALDSTLPAIQKNFDEVDVRVVELAQKVHALSLARSPELSESQTLLRMAAYERDMPKRNYSLKRTELFGKRQSLTRAVIVDTLADWRQRRIALSENIEISEEEEIQKLFDKSEFRIKSNRRSLGRVLDFLTRKEAELRAMINTASLAVIIEFVKGVEGEYLTFDPTALEFEKLDEGEHRLIREAEADAKSPVKSETAYFAKGETIRVKPQKGV